MLFATCLHDLNALSGQGRITSRYDPGLVPQLLIENADFLLEVFDDELLVVFHLAGNTHQEQGSGGHGQIFPSACGEDEHSMGKQFSFAPPKRPILN
jgi:hypothetical protein